MALTLGDARVVARVIENGICESDARVPDRINEAVARLHALGDWVGSVARYAIKLDTNHEFTIPSGIQNVMRAAALPTNYASTLAGTLITDDEYAFVLESAPVVTLRQVSPSKFRVLGPVIPVAVDVMGKKRLTPAVEDSDFLAVDDIYAIKLMVLALFREEQGSLDIATGLGNQAVAHLKTKTETSIGNARRALFTSLASGVREGTLGFARSKVALALTDGLRVDDHKLIELIGEAERRLLQQGSEWKAYLFRTRSGILSVPREIDSILRVDVDNVPTTVASQWYDYSHNGWGYREEVFSRPTTIYRGEQALHTILPSAGKLTVVTDDSENALSLTIEGISNEGLPVREDMVLNGAEVKVTSESFSAVTSITKDCGYGNVFVIREEIEVALLRADETNSKVAWYAIPSSSNGTNQIVRVLARPRWIPKLRDSDQLQVDNISAITAMCMSILKEREGDLVAAEANETRAMRFYNQQFLNREAHHGRRVEIQNRGFSGGSIRRFR